MVIGNQGLVSIMRQLSGLKAGSAHLLCGSRDLTVSIDGKYLSAREDRKEYLQPRMDGALPRYCTFTEVYFRSKKSGKMLLEKGNPSALLVKTFHVIYFVCV